MPSFGAATCLFTDEHEVGGIAHRLRPSGKHLGTDHDASAVTSVKSAETMRQAMQLGVILALSNNGKHHTWNE